MSDDVFDTPLDYRDRRVSLIVSGILLALTGCLIGLLSAFYIVFFGFAGAGFIPAPAPVLGTPASTDVFGGEMKNLMIGAGVIYGLIALGFLAVGWGNIFLKRWSRPLALILSACWAYVGLISMVWTMISISKMRQFMFGQAAEDPAGMPPGVDPDMIMNIAIIINLGFMFVFGAMLPALIFWLNLSRDARITVETCDRKPRWTDCCPVPVLGLVVVVAAGAVATLGSAAWIPFMPVFGEFLTGQKARIVMAGLALILLFIAWGAYRRQLMAWILSLVLVIASAVSGVVTFSDLNWREMYEKMGIPIPEDQMIEMEKMMEAIYSGNSMILGMILGTLPILAYLFWMLRFFKTPPADPEPAAS